MENIKGEHPTKPPLCRHSVKQTSALNQFLERVGSTPGRALSCEKCKKEMGEPLKQMKEKFLGGKFLWGCLDCEQIFCGVLSYSGPGGHIRHHAESSKHLLAVPISIWCFDCNSPKVIMAEEEGKENNEIKSEKDVMEESIGIEREEMKGLTSTNMGVYRVRFMENFGNTCFYNAVMQNLLSMNRLRTVFEKLDLQEDCRPLTKKLYNLFIVSSSDVPISSYLHDLFLSICDVNREFKNMRQQDSHEFLRCLRNGLLAERTIRVDDIFQGMLIQYTSCRCGYTSTSIVPFYDLSLVLPLERCLAEKDGHITCKDIMFPARNKDRGQENGIATVCSVAKADGAELSRGNVYAEPGSPESSNMSSCLTVPIDKWFKNMSLCLTIPIDNWFKNLSVLSRDKVAAEIDKRDKSEVEEEDSNLNFADEPIMISDSEVCGEDVNVHPNNGGPLSIQSCLDFFTAVVPVPSVCSCSKKHLEYPNTGPEGEWKSETSNFQGNDSKDMGMDRMGTTKTEIFMAPTILTIHFKKFKYDTCGEKIVCHLNFQEKLDLTPYMASSCRGKEEFHYRMIGVVEHLGRSLSSGHYVAYVKGVGSEGGKDVEGGGLA